MARQTVFTDDESAAETMQRLPDRIMPVFTTVLTEGVKITGIQQ